MLDASSDNPIFAFTFVVRPSPIAQGREILCFIFFVTTTCPELMPFLIWAIDTFSLLVISFKTFS